MKKPQALSPTAYPQTKVTREDWLAAALETLINDGVERVKVLVLAERLKVSRSSFYWYFKSRQDLLDQLLEGTFSNSRAIITQAQLPAKDITDGVLNVFDCWVHAELFNPRLDFAIREWARRSRAIRRVVDREDEVRVEALKQLFLRHGFAATDAFVRARVLYFMQLGYYALDLNETMAQRNSYVAYYIRAFTGANPSKESLAAFAQRSGA